MTGYPGTENRVLAYRKGATLRRRLRGMALWNYRVSSSVMVVAGRMASRTMVAVMPASSWSKSSASSSRQTAGAGSQPVPSIIWTEGAGAPAPSVQIIEGTGCEPAPAVCRDEDADDLDQEDAGITATIVREAIRPATTITEEDTL